MTDRDRSERRPKPNVQCPHCHMSFEAGELKSRVLGNTKWGIHIFACPYCRNRIKIEPGEYLHATMRSRSRELPTGIGIIAFKEGELTPSEIEGARDANLFDTTLSRAQTYRLAGRTLRYPIYLAIEGTWIATAAYAIGREFFFTPTNTSTAALILLIALSIVHSIKMSFAQPWQALKAILLGAIIFFAAQALMSFLGAPYSPSVPAAVIGSGYYFWLGETWTRQIANLEDAD